MGIIRGRQKPEKYAAEIGVSQATVSKYLRGESNNPRSGQANLDDGAAEFERGLDEAFDKAERKAKRERSREIIEAEIERLALLKPVEYEIERKHAAEMLELRPSVLDRSEGRGRDPKGDAINQIGTLFGAGIFDQ